jgi:hypothetical protein
MYGDEAPLTDVTLLADNERGLYGDSGIAKG